MVLTLPSFEPPFAGEPWVDKNGKPTNQFYQFINQQALKAAKINEGIFEYERFADLAAVNLVIQNPDDGDTVMFTGQGLGTYNGTAAEWRLSSNDTTAVT